MVAFYDSLRSPFLPADELTPKKEVKKEDTAKDEKISDIRLKETRSKETRPAKTDAPGVKENFPNMDMAASRLCEVPVPADNISALGANEKYLFWIQSDVNDRQNRKLFALEISGKLNNKPVEVTDNVNGYEI